MILHLGGMCLYRVYLLWRDLYEESVIIQNITWGIWDNCIGLVVPVYVITLCEWFADHDRDNQIILRCHMLHFVVHMKSEGSRRMKKSWRYVHIVSEQEELPVLELQAVSDSVALSLHPVYTSYVVLRSMSAAVLHLCLHPGIASAVLLCSTKFEVLAVLSPIHSNCVWKLQTVSHTR